MTEDLTPSKLIGMPPSRTFVGAAISCRPFSVSISIPSLRAKDSLMKKAVLPVSTQRRAVCQAPSFPWNSASTIMRL